MGLSGSALEESSCGDSKLVSSLDFLKIEAGLQGGVVQSFGTLRPKLVMHLHL